MADPTEDPTRNIFDDLAQAERNAPPELRAPLAAFGGEPPPAPAWFETALAQAPERGFVATPRGRIEVLTWGEVGRPGLLFVHGNSAHADWWSYICPFFAEHYRVTAMSLAGMGDSDWRASYSFADFALDAEAVCQATGLYEGGRKPVYIGHSFGGGQVFYVASRHPEQLHAAIIIDVGFGSAPPGDSAGPPIRTIRLYPSVAEALARFRLAPVQPVENLFILDYIARRSLKHVPAADGAAEGWRWKFDPDMWPKQDVASRTMFFTSAPQVDVPIAHLFGELSALRPVSIQRAVYPSDGLEVGIPDARHHVMIDQPLALVAAIRSLLGAWRA